MLSKTSEARLASCHPDIQKVIREAIKYTDFTILCGYRGQEEQDQAFHDGRSKLQWPDSKHNKVPAEAVDIAPYPIDWKDRERFILMAGFVMGIARQMGVKLRYGADWNRNWTIKDETFQDLPHLEIDP